MLEKVINENNFNHISRFSKHETMNTKKLQAITRQGTKISIDKQKSIGTITQKHDYPNPSMKK